MDKQTYIVTKTDLAEQHRGLIGVYADGLGRIAIEITALPRVPVEGDTLVLWYDQDFKLQVAFK